MCRKDRRKRIARSMEQKPLPKVDVAVVLWKSAEFLPALVQGLMMLEYPKDRVTIHFVENGPGDGSLTALQREIAKAGDRLPPIKIHQPGSNTGFAGGNNIVMREAIEQGSEYVFLLNHDASFEPSALKEAVTAAMQSENVGSVQSLLVLAEKPEEVNSRGNAIQYLGFGYCLGYHEARSAQPSDIRDIAYASGAAVLYPVSVLKDVGLLDETLWLYHEDLDLGWKIRLAGYRNLLAPKSVVRHRYEFSRSIQKWYWMERNRIAVVLKNYSAWTIILLLPQLFVADIARFAFALKGGWGKEKVRASAWFWRPQTWSYLLRGRQDIARIRRIPDKMILKHFTPVIAYQEFEDPFTTAVVNPAWRLLFRMLKIVVFW